MTRVLLSMIAAGALGAGSAAAAPFDAYTGYAAFGDSLTDDGKFGQLPPPSLGGRFSNGRVYAEYVADAFAARGRAAANFALGGATAEADNETDYSAAPGAGAALGTFASQVRTFAAGPARALLGDNPLVSVLFGANDLFQDLGEGTEIGDIGRSAADAVEAGIRSIAALGTAFDDFAVINLPDLSLTPGFAGTPFASLAQAETLAFNQQLAANVLDLRMDGLTVIEVDLDAFLRDVIAEPDALGLTNVTDACTPDISEFDTVTNCTFTGAGFDPSLADTFLFADNVHPTGPVHRAFAAEFAAQIAPVPLPAGLPFLLAGLGTLALVRRRGA